MSPQLIRAFPIAHPPGFPSMSSAPAISIVEDLQAALAQFTEIAAELDALLATIPSRALKGKL
jgi:hypothetical protein